MKHLLNKTLTVKQILALIILPIGIIAIIFSFMTGGEPVAAKEKFADVKDTATLIEPKKQDTSALGKLLSYVDSVNNATELTGGSWSYYLAETGSDSVICEIDVDRGLIPASVIKIVTTGTALSILGPGYRFTTSLQYDGTVDPATRTLNGNIYIRGGGDPALGSETFGSSVDKVVNGWANLVKGLGIDSIAGSIIGDAEAFERDPVPGGWAWEDMQSAYGTGPCGLNIRENTYDLMLTPAGGGVSLRTSPSVPGLKLYNQVVHNPSIGKSYAYVQGAPFQFERTVLGEISSYHEERSAIPDPALFCAQKLQQSLEDNGISVRDTATTQRLVRLNHVKIDVKEGRKTLGTTASPSLEQLVYHTNQVSQNFYAEAILRALALREKGYGSTYGGVGVVYNFWRSKGIDLRGMCMVDGCGISRFNTITTRQLAGMLRVFAKDSAVFPKFYRSLPVAGESGTIRKLADGTLAEGNLHAKSGTMSRVRAYAGYVKTKSGKLLCFAMIGNNTLWSEQQLRDKFERLFVLMAELA